MSFIICLIVICPSVDIFIDSLGFNLSYNFIIASTVSFT